MFIVCLLRYVHSYDHTDICQVVVGHCPQSGLTIAQSIALAFALCRFTPHWRRSITSPLVCSRLYWTGANGQIVYPQQVCGYTSVYQQILSLMVLELPACLLSVSLTHLWVTIGHIQLLKTFIQLYCAQRQPVADGSC